MKFLLFLICAVAAVYFFYFNKSPNTSPAPQITATAPAEAKTQKAAKAPEKTKEKSQAASINKYKEPKFKENSLGARLTELHKDRNFFFDSSKKIRFPQTPVYTIRQELQRYSQALQNARDLQKYDDLGVETEKYHVNTLLPHVDGLSQAVLILASSGFVNAADGNNKQAIEDFKAAGKILNVFLEGSSCWTEIFQCQLQAKKLRRTVNYSQLPAKSKLEIISKLPGKKDWAAAFPRLVESEKNSLLGTKTYIEAGGTFEKGVMSDSVVETLKQVSLARWEELAAKSKEFILSEWQKGTLTKETQIQIGTEKENIVLQQFICVEGFVRYLKSE